LSKRLETPKRTALCSRCRVLFFFQSKNGKSKLSRRFTSVKKEKQPVPQPQKKKGVSYGKILYSLFLMLTLFAAFSMPAYAATMWDKASEIMKDVYNQILLISTIAGIVTAAVALLLMNFSKSGKTVDESRSWLKRIIITWVILNGLGFIMAYVTPFFTGGRWNP
jgi:hypothetical protein